MPTAYNRLLSHHISGTENTQQLHAVISAGPSISRLWHFRPIYHDSGGNSPSAKTDVQHNPTRPSIKISSTVCNGRLSQHVSGTANIHKFVIWAGPPMSRLRPFRTIHHSGADSPWVKTDARHTPGTYKCVELLHVQGCDIIACVNLINHNIG